MSAGNVSAATWNTVSVIAFALAAVFLLIGIILFVKFRIWALSGELTGKTAAKQMEEIRKGNREVVGRWRKMENPSESQSGDSRRKTAILRGTEKLQEEPSPGMSAGDRRVRGTAPLGENPSAGRSNSTDLLGGNPSARRSNSTDLLGGNMSVRRSNSTDLLGGNPSGQRSSTELLGENPSGQRNSTELLGGNPSAGGNTMVLAQNPESADDLITLTADSVHGTFVPRGNTEPLEQREFMPAMGNFQIKKNVMVVHTKEIAEAGL